MPQTDVRILMLRHCLAVTPNQDDEVTLDGRRYRITGPVKAVPAGTHWELQARPDGR